MPNVVLPQAPPPERPDTDRPVDPPAVRASPRCPTCGRTQAIVFPAVHTGTTGADAPLVCLNCCPKVSDEG